METINKAETKLVQIKVDEEVTIRDDSNSARQENLKSSPLQQNSVDPNYLQMSYLEEPIILMHHNSSQNQQDDTSKIQFESKLNPSTQSNLVLPNASDTVNDIDFKMIDPQEMTNQSLQNIGVSPEHNLSIDQQLGANQNQQQSMLKLQLQNNSHLANPVDKTSLADSANQN